MTATAPESTRNTRTRLLAAAVLVLTLGAGLVIGWGVGHRPSGPRGFGPGPGPGPGPGREAPSPGHLMAKRLGLSGAQEKTIDSIFAARRTQIGAFWEGPGAQLRQIIDSTTVDIRAVLDSAQRVRFDRIQERRGLRGPGSMLGPGRPGGRDRDGHGGPPPDELPGGPPPPPER